jgi:hypothetical protein
MYILFFLWLGWSGKKKNTMYYRNIIKIIYISICAFLRFYVLFLTLLVSPPAIQLLYNIIGYIAYPFMRTE